MRKLIIRAAVVTIFTAAMTSVAGAGTAMACVVENPTRSDHLADIMPQVRYGQSGRDVLALQLTLRDLGYDLQGTGNYRQKTLAAVRAFQREHGITDSGIVGSKTWHALVGPISPMWTGNGRRTPPAFGITPGEHNEEKVAYLKNTLMRIYPYSNDTLPDEGAEYGPRMQALVRDFQHRSGIKASGIVGPKTWTALYEVVAASGHWGC